MLGYRIQSKELAALQKKTTSAAMRDDMALYAGRAVANLVKDHLFALDSRENRLGGKRTHFYSSAAKSVTDPQLGGGKVSISITKLGLAQRWLGGTIKAGQGISSATGLATKYLAIPARAEAYGQPPRAFRDLRFIPRRSGGAMLVQALQTRVSLGVKRSVSGVTTGYRNRGTVGGLVMYWLVKEVTQAKDPTVMPTEEEMLQTAVSSSGEYLSKYLIP